MPFFRLFFWTFEKNSRLAKNFASLCRKLNFQPTLTRFFTKILGLTFLTFKAKTANYCNFTAIILRKTQIFDEKAHFKRENWRNPKKLKPFPEKTQQNPKKLKQIGQKLKNPPTRVGLGCGKTSKKACIDVWYVWCQSWPRVLVLVLVLGFWVVLVLVLVLLRRFSKYWYWYWYC